MESRYLTAFRNTLQLNPVSEEILNYTAVTEPNQILDIILNAQFSAVAHMKMQLIHNSYEGVTALFKKKGVLLSEETLKSWERCVDPDEIKLAGKNSYRSSNGAIYDATHKYLWEPQHNMLQKYGLMSLHIPEKHPQGLEQRETVDTLTSLACLASTRKSKRKLAFSNWTHISCIGETDPQGRIRPATFKDMLHPIQEFEVCNYNTQKIEKCKGYTIKDCILQLDVDNGENISNILEALKALPFLPTYAVIEKGIGHTRKGSATITYTFNEPMTSATRKFLLQAIRAYVIDECDIYGIDKNATGTGYGKNPLLTVEDELTHTFLARCNDTGYNVNPQSLQNATNWATEFMQQIPIELLNEVDRVANQNDEVKHTSVSIAELLDTQSDVTAIGGYECFQPWVCIGERNNVAIQELSILALQAYALFKNKPQSTIKQVVLTAFYNRIQNYDNSDNQITDKWASSRCKWVFMKDEQTDISVLQSKIESQLNRITYNKNCALIELLKGSEFEAEAESALAALTIHKECKYTHTQSQRGAATNVIKSAIWSLMKYRSLWSPYIIRKGNEITVSISREDRKFLGKEYSKYQSSAENTKQVKRVIASLLLLYESQSETVFEQTPIQKDEIEGFDASTSIDVQNALENLDLLTNTLTNRRRVKEYIRRSLSALFVYALDFNFRSYNEITKEAANTVVKQSRVCWSVFTLIQDYISNTNINTNQTKNIENSILRYIIKRLSEALKSQITENNTHSLISQLRKVASRSGAAIQEFLTSVCQRLQIIINTMQTAWESVEEQVALCTNFRENNRQISYNIA